jgi:hypothetical protein
MWHNYTVFLNLTTLFIGIFVLSFLEDKTEIATSFVWLVLERAIFSKRVHFH